MVYEPAAKKQLLKSQRWDSQNFLYAWPKISIPFRMTRKNLGRPSGFNIHVREVYVSAGAGFVVALTGAVMTMPGLPRVPAANGIDVTDDGRLRDCLTKEKSMARLIDGKRISKRIKDELKEEVSRMKEQGTKICLAVIQVGEDPASSVYVNNKKKACAYIGIESQSYELLASTTEEELVDLVKRLNDSPEVNGILVQLPLPKAHQ